MRDHMKVGMTAGESLAAMVKAMEDVGPIYIHLIPMLAQKTIR